MNPPAGLVEVARSPFFWLEVGIAVAVGVCFTLGHTAVGWVLVGVWALVLAGDLLTRDTTGDGTGGGA